MRDVGGAGSRQKNEIQSRLAVRQLTKSFARATFYTIAMSRKPNMFFCDGESKTVMAAVVAAGEKQKFILSGAQAVTAEHQAVVARTEQSFLSAKRV